MSIFSDPRMSQVLNDENILECHRFYIITVFRSSLKSCTKLLSICRHCAGTIDGPVCYCDSGEQCVLGHPSYLFFFISRYTLVSIYRHCAGTIDGPVCYCDSGEQWVLGHPSNRFFFLSRYKVSIHM